MTTEEFTRDPARREALAKALASPALVEAIAIVKKEMEPKRGGSADAATVIAASYFHQVAGANHILTKLHDLAAPPVERKAPKTRPPLAKSEADLPKE